jgi:hypothetical protein
MAKVRVMKYGTFTKYKFYVQNVELDLETALKIWKKTYESYPEFYKNIIAVSNSSQYDEFGDSVVADWDNIPDISVAEAFSQKNLEVRRLFFKAIGTTKLFAELEPVLVDTNEITQTGVRFNADGTSIETKISDKYELYKIDGAKLFPEETSEWRLERASIYAVRCWCSTTEREYWIYVPKNIGEKNKAIEAIAWTVRLEHEISDVTEIYRQGDVIVAKIKEDSVSCSPYHLTEEQYVKLLKFAS